MRCPPYSVQARLCGVLLACRGILFQGLPKGWTEEAEEMLEDLCTVVYDQVGPSAEASPSSHLHEKCAVARLRCGCNTGLPAKLIVDGCK